MAYEEVDEETGVVSLANCNIDVKISLTES